MNDRTRTLTRRQAILAGTGLFGLGAGIGWSLRGTPPDDSRHDVGSVDDLLAAIRRDGWFGFRPSVESGEPTHAVIRWDPTVVATRDQVELAAADIYGGTGANAVESNPLVDASTGLMVLWLRSTHLGCRVQHCASSGWFEDTCHGSRFNDWGEWGGGPAPRGLDHRQSWIEDGRLLVNLHSLVPGVPRELGVLRQDPTGPDCLQY